MKTHCFKAYDVRGRMPDEINEVIASRTAYAYAKLFNAKQVAVGKDIRLSSEVMAEAVIEGLLKAGADVFELGMCGTENVYFAVAHGKLDGGIMVTASHNPMDYNGLKLVKDLAQPIGQDSGLRDIQTMVEDDSVVLPEAITGKRQPMDAWDDYIQHLLSYVAIDALRPLKILVNPGNGGAGLVMERLEKYLPFRFVRMDFEPDGTFPNGVPNPLLPENQGRTAERVRAEGADLGIAWDGDYDRCFLFDEKGDFVNGYYLVGLIASELLNQAPGSKIVHDPRLVWNTIRVVEEAGGVPVISRTGHSFIKALMREQDAIYGGEISGHHYFRDFYYCDSGMVPWLLVVMMISRANKPLSSLVADYQSSFPASDEMNRRVKDAATMVKKVEEHYIKQAMDMDYTDGLSMVFEDWRFNLRSSNTEPLLRLNIETRRDDRYLNTRISEVNGLLDQLDSE